MDKLKAIFVAIIILSIFSTFAYSSVGLIEKETVTQIVSILKNGTFITSNGMKFYTSSTNMLKKAEKFKESNVKIIYYERERKKYCQDIEMSDSTSFDSGGKSQKIIIERKVQKKPLL
jgi:hypothetical protein